MNLRPVARFAAVAVLVAGIAAGCSGGDDNSASTQAAPVPAPKGLQIGIQDDRLAHATEDPNPRMDTIKGLGAQVVRVDMRWDVVAPHRPENPTDPEDPAYDWRHYDRVVDAAKERGIALDIAVWGTPTWAADTSPEATDAKDFPTAPFGARPKDPADAGAFAQAAAARYGPKGVHMWEAWNEPNGPLFLRPQWRKEGDRYVPESPRTYSEILKAMYVGFKKGDPNAIVAGGVTAPAGDKTVAKCPFIPENCRVTPQDFVRGLDAPELRPPMDAYAHHPYPLRPPTDTTSPDANYIDLYNLPTLTTLLDQGYLKGVPVWLTEFGVATEKTANQPFFRSPALQEEYLIDGLKRVRSQPRVTMFIWYFLQDGVEWKSGLYDLDGKAKPAARAFKEATASG